MAISMQRRDAVPSKIKALVANGNGGGEGAWEEMRFSSAASVVSRWLSSPATG